MMQIGIAGYGLIGRLLTFELLTQGHQVTVFDQDLSGHASASIVAAGMLCPYSEIESPSEIFQMGLSSIDHWLRISTKLKSNHWLTVRGSLVVAHPEDMSRMTQFRQRLTAKGLSQSYTLLNKADMINFEPELKISSCLYFNNEGVVNSRHFLAEIAQAVRCFDKIRFQQKKVINIEPYRIQDDENKIYNFDCVIDCRGIGAKDRLKTLRGVRGEVIRLFAPEVNLSRPIRMLHPRYHLYIVPRDGHEYVIGASEIESEDLSPITVRSTLELLSAAFSVHSGFSEAKIIETLVGLRPTLPSHIPDINTSKGMISINGLYRHGFLLSPLLVNKVANKLLGHVYV